MIKKLKLSQFLRLCIQLILFVLLPGLYAMIFSEIKTIYEMIYNGNFNLIQVFSGLLECVTVMFFTIIIGRWFCGWICAFGTYNDLIHHISKKIFKINFKVNEKVDNIFKYAKFIVLLVIIILGWNNKNNVLQGLSPWQAFASLTDPKILFSNMLIGLILLLLITIGAFFIERFFCRYLCPLGAIFFIISKFGITKINKPKEHCGKCRACTNNCSMGLKLYKINTAKGGDCINCLKCAEVCPKRNANVNVFGKKINPQLAGLIAMVVFLIGTIITNISGKLINTYKLNENKSVSKNTNSSKYKDGTYEGSGKGFKGGITKVSVTVKNGEIYDIKTLSQGDTPQYYEKSLNILKPTIISTQTSEVDTVSGATYSSKGIISAVKEALNKAQ